MAEIFHGTITVNDNTGNWLALPALPAGLAPRRRIFLRGGIVLFGYCTAGQSVQDANVFTTGGNFNRFASDCGVLDYSRLTVRSTAAPADIFIYSLSNTDEGPRGM